MTQENLDDMVKNHGVQVTDPDVSELIRIADKVAPLYAESIGEKELYDKIQDALGR